MYLILVGVIARFVARLLVPGRDAIGFWWTILLGIAGSFAGGFLAWALFGWDEDERCTAAGRCHLLDHRRRAHTARVESNRSTSVNLLSRGSGPAKHCAASAESGV